MPGKATLRAIGDWRKEVGVGLQTALAVSMDVMGRTGEEACRHALILMAQSARALTKQARKNRRIKKDQHGRYIEDLRAHSGRSETRWYDWLWQKDDPPKATWEQLHEIKNRGLAKRSWMWGLRQLGAKQQITKAIPGASFVGTISRPNENGYLKENRIHYITKAMPVGWESTVMLKAGNKIMAQAKRKMERQWARDVRRRRRATERNVKYFFKKALAA